MFHRRKSSKDGGDSSSLSSYAMPYNWVDNDTKSSGGPAKSNDQSNSMEMGYVPTEDPDPLASYISSVRNIMMRSDQPTLDLGECIMMRSR